MTDPRLRDYTDEMLMIEMAFLRQEKPEWFNGDNFSDPNYEEWAQNVAAEESKILRDTKERAEKVIETAIDVDLTEKPKVDVDLDDEENWEPVE